MSHLPFCYNNIKEILNSFNIFLFPKSCSKLQTKLFLRETWLRSNRFREARSNCRVGQFRDTSLHSQLTLCRADLANGLCHAGRMEAWSHWSTRPSLRSSSQIHDILVNNKLILYVIISQASSKSKCFYVCHSYFCKTSSCVVEFCRVLSHSCRPHY